MENVPSSDFNVQGLSKLQLIKRRSHLLLHRKHKQQNAIV